MDLNLEDVLLKDVDMITWKKLTTALQKENNWKRLVEYLPLFEKEDIVTMSEAPCPAERLLNILSTKLCSVGSLIYILKESFLFDVLPAICPPERMRVIKQPTDFFDGSDKISIVCGGSLLLKFIVEGVPMPEFQWVKDNEFLQDATSSTLEIKHFLPSMEGLYTCIVTQETCRFVSNLIEICMSPIACSLIAKPDEFVCLYEDNPLVLKLKVKAYPLPTFQWVFGNEFLKNETKDTLIIRKTKSEHSGEYRCFVSNKYSEITYKTDVIVYKENVFGRYNKLLSNKVALLIGNNTYKNLEPLGLPENDVVTVAQILEELGFRVMCFNNFTLYEMQVAMELLADCIDQDSFVLFYYAGHGFEIGDRFMLPTDSPDLAKLTKNDAISESKLLEIICKKKPVLFLLILDMCLKSPNIEKCPKIYQDAIQPCMFSCNRNLIRIYTTTSHLSAYEDRNNENGVYVSVLKKYLKENIPILSILRKVNSDISILCPQQIPCIYFVTTLDYFLSNPASDTSLHNHKYYNILNIKEKILPHSRANCALTKYKVFNNAIDVTLSNFDNLEVTNPNEIQLVKINQNGKIILRLLDLQRLEDALLKLSLKIDGEDLLISQRLEIVDIFCDI